MYGDDGDKGIRRGVLGEMLQFGLLVNGPDLVFLNCGEGGGRANDRLHVAPEEAPVGDLVWSVKREWRAEDNVRLAQDADLHYQLVFNIN